MVVIMSPLWDSKSVLNIWQSDNIISTVIEVLAMQTIIATSLSLCTVSLDRYIAVTNIRYMKSGLAIARSLAPLIEIAFYNRLGKCDGSVEVSAGLDHLHFSIEIAIDDELGRCDGLVETSAGFDHLHPSIEIPFDFGLGKCYFNIRLRPLVSNIVCVLIPILLLL